MKKRCNVPARLQPTAKTWKIRIGGNIHFLLTHASQLRGTIERKYIRGTWAGSRYIALCEILGFLKRTEVTKKKRPKPHTAEAKEHAVSVALGLKGKYRPGEVIYTLTPVGRKALKALRKGAKARSIGSVRLPRPLKVPGQYWVRYPCLYRRDLEIEVPVKINKARYEYHKGRQW